MAIVVADTSVLINFLKIDRMDLIGCHPVGFIVTDHVRAEISDRYQSQVERYATALSTGNLKEEQITNLVELELFGRLSTTPRLGSGECSAIAVALNRGHALAIDDARAIRHALREAGLMDQLLTVVRTADIVVDLILAGAIELREAEALRVEWELKICFRMSIRSFSELIAERG